MRQTVSFGALCLALVAIAGCGGQKVVRHTALERTTLLVLYQKGAEGCVPRVAEKFRAYEGDTVVWEVVNECNETRLVEIQFTGPSVPVTWVAGPAITVDAGRTKQLRATVKTGTVGRHGYNPHINGKPGKDPELEIDPYF